MNAAKIPMKIPIEQYRQVLFRYLRPQRPRVFLLAVLLLSSIGLQLVNPQLLRAFVDTVSEGGDQQTLIMLALVFIGLALAQQVIAVSAVYVGESVGWFATNLLRSDLAMHCLRLDMTFHHVRTPGEMIERVDSDVTQIAMFFSQFVIMVLGNILLLVGVVVLLFIEDPRVGIAMALFSLATLYALNRVRNLAVPAWAQARESSAKFDGFLEEQLSGTEDTRSSGAVPFMMRKFYMLTRDRLQSERRAGYMNMVIFGVIVTCVTLGTILALVMGYWLYTAGMATVGTVLLFVTYTNMLFKPMREITMQIQELQRAGAGIGRVNELLAIRSKVDEGQDAAFPQGALSVEFDHVTFAYHADDPVLKDFSFYLEPGRVLGLLGRTGSGKTTITRLLFRLYDVTGGSIRLGGVDIRAGNLHDLRQHVGIVTQDVQLFRATVRDNLTFFDRSIPDERILEAIDDLGLRDWLDKLPKGLDSEMRSGGSGLSAGEAQLLAFTRVFLKDPGLVILDEASSRLDPVTEQRIERAIDKLLHNRTAIIVAHRLATVQRADEIMIIENGRIREHDRREDLVRDHGSHFYQLLQTGLEEALA
jgi:ATP-binding cassette subfamily B protein